MLYLIALMWFFYLAKMSYADMTFNHHGSSIIKDRSLMRSYLLSKESVSTPGRRRAIMDQKLIESFATRVSGYTKGQMLTSPIVMNSTPTSTAF